VGEKISVSSVNGEIHGFWFGCGGRTGKARNAIELSPLLMSPIVESRPHTCTKDGRVRLGANDIRESWGGEIGLSVCERPFSALASGELGKIWMRVRLTG